MLNDQLLRMLTGNGKQRILKAGGIVTIPSGNVGVICVIQAAIFSKLKNDLVNGLDAEKRALEGETLPALLWLRGRYTEVTLTSGIAVCYMIPDNTAALVGSIAT